MGWYHWLGQVMAVTAGTLRAEELPNWVSYAISRVCCKLEKRSVSVCLEIEAKAAAKGSIT